MEEEARDQKSLAFFLSAICRIAYDFVSVSTAVTVEITVAIADVTARTTATTWDGTSAACERSPTIIATPEHIDDATAIT